MRRPAAGRTEGSPTAAPIPPDSWRRRAAETVDYAAAFRPAGRLCPVAPISSPRARRLGLFADDLRRVLAQSRDLDRPRAAELPKLAEELVAAFHRDQHVFPNSL